MITKKTRAIPRFTASCFALAILLSAGCASTAPRTAEEAVTQRAQERLDLYLEGNFAEAYEYLSPGYRSGVSRLEYQRQVTAQPFNWTSARVVASECSESSCKLKISVGIVVYGALPGVPRYETTTAITENWIKSGRTWYFVPSS